MLHATDSLTGYTHCVKGRCSACDQCRTAEHRLVFQIIGGDNAVEVGAVSQAPTFCVASVPSHLREAGLLFEGTESPDRMSTEAENFYFDHRCVRKHISKMCLLRYWIWEEQRIAYV